MFDLIYTEIDKARNKTKKKEEVVKSLNEKKE